MTIELFFATNNKDKLKEAEYILNKYGVVLKPITIDKIEIQSDSLKEIAVYAVKSIYKIIGKPVVVEDSGLFIDALNGFPGPYSSYVYKTIGLKGVLKLLDGVIDRRAKFIAVVALAFNDNVCVFEGSIEGYISLEIRGDKGFGFDPIFIPVGSNKTFGEMDIEEKSMYSHRGKAFKELATWVLNNRDKLFNTE